MSVILDALKKLEQEKQNRAPGPVKVRTESLLRGIDAPRRNRGWVVPAVILVFAAVLGTAVYFIKGDTKAPPQQVDATAPAARPAEEVPAPSLVPAAPTPVPQETPAAAASAALPPSEARKEAAPAPAEAASIARARAEKHQRTSSRGSLRPPETSRRAGAPVSQETPSDIMVSGIAWQESRTDRRAVVNGGLYAEGATVGGAAIVQIQQDRVRFTRDGRIFDVPLATPFPAR